MTWRRLLCCSSKAFCWDIKICCCWITVNRSYLHWPGRLLGEGTAGQGQTKHINDIQKKKVSVWISLWEMTRCAWLKFCHYHYHHHFHKASHSSSPVMTHCPRSHLLPKAIPILGPAPLCLSKWVFISIMVWAAAKWFLLINPGVTGNKLQMT